MMSWLCTRLPSMQRRLLWRSRDPCSLRLWHTGRPWYPVHDLFLMLMIESEQVTSPQHTHTHTHTHTFTPSFFRSGSHSSSDDQRLYQPMDIVKQWTEGYNPVKRLQGYLVKRGLWNQGSEGQRWMKEWETPFKGQGKNQNLTWICCSLMSMTNYPHSLRNKEERCGNMYKNTRISTHYKIMRFSSHPVVS